VNYSGRSDDFEIRQTGRRQLRPDLAKTLLALLMMGGVLGGVACAAEDGPRFPDAQPGRLPVPVLDIPGVERGLYRDGRVFLAGQPNPAALARFRSLGVTAVVNVRTPEEMANPAMVPFDLPRVVTELGMEYVSIPFNGRDYPYTTSAVDRFATVMERHRGPVLVFCNAAVRVSYLWAAYLVRHRGFDINTAMAHGRAAGIPPDPMAGLLGRQFRLILE